MSTDLFKIFIVCIYAVLVYKFYKNTVLLLLFTLATILALCNINKIKEGYSISSIEQYAAAEFDSINNYDKVDIYDKMRNSNKNNKNNKNNSNNSNNSNTVRVSNNNIDITSNSDGSYVNVDAIVNDIIPVSPMNYQMGPYDQLVLTTGNPKSEYLRLVNAPLATDKNICVYQGHENPLECKKTTGVNIGPPINGVLGSPQNMFMFSNNKSSPNCCPSTFSTSTGCVCTTENQRKFVNSRGMAVN
jgi:hypothetical protein